LQVPIETSAGGGGGGGGGELPREAALMLQQLADDTDAVIEVDGSRILLIGTSDGISACQQKIAQLQVDTLPHTHTHTHFYRNYTGSWSRGCRGWTRATRYVTRAPF